MHVVMGATGQTGSMVIKELLLHGAPVRAVLRTPPKNDLVLGRGVEAAVADFGDADALLRAFQGADTLYLMNPPAYGEADLFARARHVHFTAIATASAANIRHIVALSSVGAQHATGTGNIRTTYDLEQQLEAFSGDVTILRAANFMENWGWSLHPVQQSGALPSMFLPLDQRLPMVSARDIGSTAADLMMNVKSGRHIVELSGPQDYSPNDTAATLSELLGRTIQPVAVPVEGWAAVFEAQHMPPAAVQGFIEMYQGFNSGLIAFEGNHETRRGTTSLRDVLSRLLVEA